jgi:hypothetical protein
VHEQAVPQTLTLGAYNEITLTNPVTINTSQELWMAYQLQTSQYNQYPAGCDAGPHVAGKGDLMFFNGAWSNLYDLTSGKYNANWNIEGFVETGGTPPPPPECKYNVYRDGTIVASNITATFYTDKGFSAYQNHTWTVRVVCENGGESTATSVTKGSCIVGMDEKENTTLSVIPNPTNGQLQVTGYELQVTGIEVFDVFGRTVGANLCVRPDGSHRLQIGASVDISHLPAGVYFIRIQTETGMVTRKVVKQ